MVKAIGFFFVLLSLPIIWVSRRSLLHPTSYGFYRFFAFEAILVLIVINFPYWFVRAGSLQQLISWILLGISLIIVVWALVLLRRFGGFQPTEEGSPQFDWENTQNLVTTGIYKYVRHPMYASLFFLTWGALLKSVILSTFILALVATLALLATAKAEEAVNLSRFGPEYQDYMKRTRRFVPFVL